MPEAVRVKNYPVDVLDSPATSVEKFKVAEAEGMIVLLID